MRSFIPVLFVLTLCLIGCSGKKEPDGKGTSTQTAQNTEKDETPREIKIESTAFAAEWKQDREAAARKYASKVIEITGRVKNLLPVDLEDPNGVCIFLENDGTDLLGVRCTTTDKQAWKR